MKLITQLMSNASMTRRLVWRKIVNRKQCITSVLFRLAINLNYLPILTDWDFSVICYFLDTWIKPSIALSPLTLLPFNRNNYIMPFYVGMQMISDIYWQWWYVVSVDTIERTFLISFILIMMISFFQGWEW